MRAIAYGTVLAALALGGCWTNRSSAEGFVRDVSASKRGIVVEYCDINFEVDRSLFEMLPDHHRDSGTIGVDGCSRLGVPGLSTGPFVPPKPKPKPDPDEVLDPNEAVATTIIDTEESP